MLVFRLAVLFRPLRSSCRFPWPCSCRAVETGPGHDHRRGQRGLGAELLSYPVISTSTVIFMVSGLQVLLVGMVAEALAVRR